MHRLIMGLVAFPASLVAQESERLAAAVAVTGVVFVDRNGNGLRDPGEPGLADVAVSDQATVVLTDAQGRFALEARGYGFVFIVQPDGYLAHAGFWRRAEPHVPLAFPLRPVEPARSFTFVHASDTHLSDQSLPRMRRFRALVDSLRPAFVLITGDLVRDALRVPEAEATGYYDLLDRELRAFTVPVFTVPGNHEIFGIERHRSLVSPSHPLYGRRMYRSRLGPDYYAFTWGGVHFVGLNSVDYVDVSYHGHVDSLQLAWLERMLAHLPDGPVVTFNHIPFASASEILSGMQEDNVAPTLIRIAGRTHFRHGVYNVDDVLSVLGNRLEIALGGHFHRREFLRYETAHGTRRFAQTAAITFPARTPEPLGLRSGFTVYRVRDGRVDDGTFIALDFDGS